MKRLAYVALGLALGLAIPALATKTATLTGPTDITSWDKWQRVCLSPLVLNDAGGQPQQGVVATIDACSRDATNPAIVECKSSSAFRAQGQIPAQVTTIVNYMVNLYCTENGC